MWYKIDYNRLEVLYLPTLLRNPILVAYLQSLLVPLDSLYYDWSVFRNDNLYKLQYTGQVCYLRKVLNDRFDPELRRIRIGDGQLYETVYIYTEAEAQNVYIHTEAESDTLWLRTEAETTDTGLDFIVYVPAEIYNTQLYALKALVDFYKAGGKRYNIFIDE